MKNMLKNKDGYVLAYVVVVIAVVSLIAVAACTATVRNYKSQSAALAYTQEKYAAEGVVERFVAELKDAAVEVAEKVAEDVKDNRGVSATLSTYGESLGLSTYVGSEEYIKLSIQDGIERAGIVDEMTNAGFDIEVSGTPIEFKNYTYQEKDELSGEVKTYADDDNGYFEMKMKVVVNKGQVRVDAEIVFGFEAEVETVNENKYFKLTDVFFNFTSYEVTTTTGR